MMGARTSTVAAVATSALLALAACGGEEPPTAEAPPTVESPDAGPTGAASGEGAPEVADYAEGSELRDAIIECLEDRGHDATDEGSGFGSYAQIQVNGGSISTLGMEIYLYETVAEAEQSLEDLGGAYQFVEFRVLGAAAVTGPTPGVESTDVEVAQAESDLMACLSG